MPTEAEKMTITRLSINTDIPELFEDELSTEVRRRFEALFEREMWKALSGGMPTPKPTTLKIGKDGWPIKPMKRIRCNKCSHIVCGCYVA